MSGPTHRVDETRMLLPMPKALKARLRAEAERLNMSMAAVVRAALEEWLASEAKREIPELITRDIK